MKIKKVIEYTFTVDTDILAGRAYLSYLKNPVSISEEIKKVINSIVENEDKITKSAIMDNYDKIYKDIMQKVIKLRMNEGE